MASLPEAWLAAPPVVIDDRGRPADQRREEEARASGQAALTALYAAHGAAVHRFLCDLLGDRIAAADAAQEVFVRAFRRLHTLEATDRPAAWLFGIARNVSLEHRRAQRRSRKVMDDAPLDPWDDRYAAAAPGSPEDELIGREAIGIVRGALARLSEDRRAALVLRLDHGLSYEEIARLFEWSVPKAKIEIHRARQILREALDPHDGGDR